MTNKRGDQHGIALLIALAALGAISVSAILIVSQSNEAIRLASAVRDELIVRQAELSGLDAISMAVAAGLAGAGGQTTLNVQVGDTTVAIAVRPEAAKLDLNASDEALMARLFAAISGDSQKAGKLAAAIADWRDADTLVRLNGAEADAYRDAGLKHTPANAPFKSVDELNLVLGAGPALADCLRPYVTTRSGVGTLDTTAIDPFLREALDLPSLATGPAAVSVISGSAGRNSDVYEVKMTITRPVSNSPHVVVYTVRFAGLPDLQVTILDRQQVSGWAEASAAACAGLRVRAGGPS